MLRHFLDNLWRWASGYPEVTGTTEKLPDYESLKESEWSTEFERLMRNRLIFGAVRYGVMGHGSVPKGKPTYNRAASIRTRLTKFEQTGNAEFLVDIANIALLMYEERYHPNFHFNSIDDGYHDEIKKTNG